MNIDKALEIARANDRKNGVSYTPTPNDVIALSELTGNVQGDVSDTTLSTLRRALANAQESDQQRGTVSGTPGAQVNRNPLLDILPAPSAAARESVKNGFALTPPKNSIGYRSSGERNFSGGGASLEDGTRSYTAASADDLWQGKYIRYMQAQNEPDFAEKSAYRSTRYGDAKANVSGYITDTGFGDVRYDYINRDKDARSVQGYMDTKSDAAFLGLDDSERKEMTDEEIAVFNYLYAQDTANGDAEHRNAYAYIDFLTGDLNARQRAAAQEKWAEYANEHPVKASAFSVMTSPMKGLSYIGQMTDYLKDGKIDQNAGYNKFSYGNSAIRGEVSKKIEESGKWGKVGSFLYQTGMSMGDFLLNTAITGGNQALSLAIMGTGAAADATIEAKDRGLTDDQAFTLGTIAGLAEVITEKVSIEALLDKTTLTKSAMGYFLKNTLAEGSEEVGSDLINLLADILVSKDKSEWQTSIDAYEAEGMSESDALWHAVRDQALNMGLDFLGGALSGAAMSGPVAGVNAISRANAENRTGRALGAEGADTLVNIGLSMDGEAKALAEKLNAKQKSGKALTNREVGQLYRAISMSVDGEGVGASGNPTVSSARESGVSESTAAMARRLSEITGRNIVFYSAAAENRGGRTYTENGYYDGEGTLHINAQSANPTAQIIAHELTHALEGTEGYQAFRDAVLNRMAQGGQDVAQLRQQTAEMYQRAGRPASDVDSELVAQYVEKSLLTDEAAIRDICVSQPTAARRILNWLDGILAKLGSQKAQERAEEREFLETARSFYRRGLAEVNAAGNVNRQTSTENVNIPGQETDVVQNTAKEASGDGAVVQNTAGRTTGEAAAAQTAAQTAREETEAERRKRESYKDVPGLRWKSVAPARVDELLRTGLTELDGQQGFGNDGEVADAWQYSIKETTKNAPFVEVEQDILAGVPEADWVKTVKANLKQKFPNGITVGNSEINIDYQSRNEMTFSDYMKWLYKNDPQKRADKLRATNNADEILLATTDWVNEGLNHPRKDKIVDFARGNILLRVGGNDYTAEVVVGTKKNGSMLLYDILNLQPTSFTAKETDAAIAENPSPGTNRSTASVSDSSLRNSGENVNSKFSVSEGKTQDELLDFVTQFQRATEERLAPKETTKETAKESAEDNAEAIRGDLEQLAELARQSEEAQGIKRLTPEETAESKVNARVGDDKPGFRDRLRHPGQTIRDAGESLRQAGESVRDTGRYFYRKLVDSGEAVSRVGKQSGDRHLYAYYNKARASTNAAISMIENAATDINGRVTGKSLNAVLDPIRAKGDDYYNRFQLYLFHLHNVDRMSIANFQVEEAIRDGLSQFRLENPELNQYTDAEIREFARDESNELCPQARDYLELQRALDKAAAQNKPVFGAVTAYESEALAERLKQEHPEFEELAKDVYKYIDNLLQYCVDTGLIRPGDKENLQRKYPHYVPTYRVIENQSSAPRGRQNVQKIGDAIGRAKGSDLPLMPLHKQLAQKTFSTVREGSKNLFAQRLLDMHNDDIRSVFRWRGEQVENGEKKAPNGWNIIVRDRGIEYQMNVSPAMYEAFKALSPDSAETARFLKGMRSANDLFKRLCTSDNPTFLARNFLRDLQDAGINTKNGAAFAKAYPRAWKEMKNGGEYWQAYQALGGTYSSFFDYQKGETKRATTKLGKAKEKTVGKFNLLNEAVEQAPRFAEFIATIDRAGGMDKASTDVMMDAIYNAAEVTTNFGRSGEWSRFLNRYLVPFFNPSVQGADKMIRNITETKGFKPWASLVVRAAIFGFGGELLAKILNSVLHKDDKEWDLIRQSDKDLYYLFKIKDGLWLRIPKGRVTSVIGMIGSRVGNAVQGKDTDWAETFSTAASQVAPTSPFEANIFKNFTDAKLFDKTDPGTTWYGGDIESQRLQNLKPEERYDAGTDAISKWIGKETGLSPKKINYLLDQYSGVVGDIFLPLLSERPWEGLFRKSFTLNTTRSNRLSGEFYDRADELLWAKDDSGADAVVNRWWNHVSDDIGDINKAIREIESDSGKKDTEKNELLTVQYGLRNVAMQNALETEEEYRAAAEKAYKAAELGMEDDKISEAYREANRAVFGAEYALKVYNSRVYEKAAEAVKKGSTWDAYYDSYFGAKEYEGWFKYLSAAKQPFNDKIKMGTLSEMMDDDTYEALEEAHAEGISVYNYVSFRYDISNLKSDKDKDGNIIPGSKKEKVVEVIDGLNLTSEQKDFLYLQQNYAESTLGDTPWHKRK